MRLFKKAAVTEVNPAAAAELADLKGRLAAFNKAMAMIEFNLDGTIITANDNFLAVMGYKLSEITGRHHSIFVDPEHRASAEYRRFWENLARGNYESGQYQRRNRGGQPVWIQGSYNPVLGTDGKPCKVVKIATDITEQKYQARMNSAFKGALDNVTANVMVADMGNQIIYVNEAARQLMLNGQADFRKDLPSFDASRLVGTNIDTFHKSPAHQRGLLSALSKTFTSQFKIGSRTMKITANPMLGEGGERLGTVVEWVDRTQEVAIEGEVQQIVARAVQGDLEGRISLEGKSGFFHSLSTVVNELVTNVAAVVDQVQVMIAAANAGDLTRRVDMVGKSGLFVRVGTGINQLTENMAGIVSEAKDAAEEVSRGADEISTGNTNLSQRTEEQASSLEETASSMEQMTSTVRQNADNAARANQLAVAARDQAEKGGTVVASAVESMTQINEASRKIADIIGVIDEIAFQTNLLALNAAVEAARAGEQGRGFAVVASEVRNLAGRSATAAKEIKSLIQNSVQRVEEGSSLVSASGATLEQIVASVKKVTDIVAEIAAASQEQASGIEQVNKAVLQLDELTQQNAALVEEASAAGQSMAEQARRLNDSMQRYKVNPGSSGRDASRQAAPAASPAERRAPGRPWSAPPAATRAKAAPRVMNATDGNWKEF